MLYLSKMAIFAYNPRNKKNASSSSARYVNKRATKIGHPYPPVIKQIIFPRHKKRFDMS